MGRGGQPSYVSLCVALSRKIVDPCDGVVDFISTTFICIYTEEDSQFFHGFLIFGVFADSAKFTFHDCALP